MAKRKFDPLAMEIFALKKQLNVVILAHNYQLPEFQDVSDAFFVICQPLFVLHGLC